MSSRTALCLLGMAGTLDGSLAGQQTIPTEPGRHRVEIPSSIDRSFQPAYLTLPTSRDSAAPLAVLLHTWSTTLEQRNRTVEAEAEARGWLLLAPNFRGRNDHPEACGSRPAQQDILDAVAWVRRHYGTDSKRIYLVGFSGGSYMTMLMASRHPDIWAAASAWAGISDLRVWYAEHERDDYGAMMRGCFGGSPDQSKSIGAAYRERSPITYLNRTLKVPMDLAAGRSDTVVAAAHTLRAFDAISPAAITPAEITALMGPGDGLPSPAVSDTASDPLIERRVFLRRSTGLHRITIYDDGHGWYPRAAIAWLERHQRP